MRPIEAFDGEVARGAEHFACVGRSTRGRSTRRRGAFAGVLSLAGAILCCGGKTVDEASGDRSPNSGADLPTVEPPTKPAEATPDPPPLEIWKPYPDYDPRCQFFVPARPLPGPKWGPCSEDGKELPGPRGLACRQLILDPSDRGPDHAAIFDVGPNGRVSMAYIRMYGGSRATVVADVDGPVRHAFLERGPCGIGMIDLHEGKFVASVSGYAPMVTGGAIGGGVEDASPRVLFRSDGEVGAFAVGASGFIEDTMDTDRRYSFAAGHWVEILSPPPGGGSSLAIQWNFRFQDDDVFFWNDAEDLTSILNVRPRGTGPSDVRKLLFGDAAQNAGVPARFATDGNDMVWLEFEGVRNDGPVKASIWTAKYTTDPVILHARRRRLRSDFANMLGINQNHRFAVGCGYAAHDTFDDANRRGGVRIVRLSDGISWDLFSKLEQKGYIRFGEAAALTCDELFVNLRRGDNPRDFTRLRLDSLGPGIPPD